MPLPRSAVTDALLELIRETGLPVGDGDLPDGYPVKGRAHAILYSIDGGAFSGPAFSGPQDDAAWVFQVTSAGWQRDQAEQAADRVRAAVLSSPLSVPGCAIGERTSEGPAGATKEGDLFNVAERFVLMATPRP